jgi:ribosomal protein S18
LQSFNNQGNEVEFSSIFPFRINNIDPSNNSNLFKPIHKEETYSYGNSDFNYAFRIFTDCLLKEPFHFEPSNYQSGYAIPSVLNLKVVTIPYYEILDEIISQNVTDKGKIGQITQQTTTIKSQKLKYIIDANTFANSNIILVCKVKSVDEAHNFLSNYLKAIGFKKNKTCDFIYNESSNIMQQLLVSLYDYWPTNQSQITSMKIGGKTISANYSGRGKYDLRLEEVNEEIKNRIINGDHIENITLKPSISIRGMRLRKPVPKITINEQGVINCKANINYENFTIVKWFIEETIRIIKQLNKDKKPQPSYSKIEDFFPTDTYSLIGSNISIYDNSLKINSNENPS